MSTFGTKVVAVIDTQSTFGTTIKQLTDTISKRSNLTDDTLNIPTVVPVKPIDGDIYFDKSDLSLKIYVDDGNSQQWVQL